MQDTFEQFEQCPFIYKNEWIEIRIFVNKVIVDGVYEFQIDSLKYQDILETLIQIKSDISQNQMGFKTKQRGCIINKEEKVVYEIDPNFLQHFYTRYGNMVILPESSKITVNALTTLISYLQQLIYVNDMKEMFDYHPDNQIVSQLSDDFKSHIFA